MREKILKALKQKGSISGEELGREFNISRSAVWKHIKELRNRGYTIESSPRRGYSFLKDTDKLVPEEIQADLSTDIMGRHILYRQEVSSTQDVADRMARSGAAEGEMVVSEMQKKGRGRRGRTWISPPDGGVYFSIVLRPDRKPVDVVQIPLVTGVALAKAIEKVTSLKPKIKWPNDVQIKGKKIAGILADINCEVYLVNYIILGIGINVNTRMASLPQEVRDTATSLADECGKEISRVEMVRQFLREFEPVYREFITNGFKNIAAQWRAMSNTIGARVRIIDGDEETLGRAIDIDENGFLIIEADGGEIKKIAAGDVSLRNL